MPAIDERALRSAVAAMLGRHPAVGFALGVVRDGTVEFFHGHGVADVPSRTPVTLDTVFRVASITKTFTAIAAMQLCEAGLLDLDAPAQQYLRAYLLVPTRAEYRPATVRHLMTHTAGIGEVVPASGLLRPDFGESVPVGRPIPSLAAYYRGALRVAAEPGTRFRYTNHGPATLGQIVAEVSGLPLERYLRERVFTPLGMTDTDLVRSPRVTAGLATGYTLRAGGARPVAPREMVTAGAASAYSTPRDMARYLAALLGGGANEHGSVLAPATLAAMFAPQYQPDPRVPGLGLAFFRATAGGRPLVEHQGILPGFHSQIVLAPEDGVGVMAFTNGARNAMLWLPAETGTVLHRLLGVPDEVIRTDVPHRPETWQDLCGWYHLPGPLTDARVRSMVGAGMEVFVRGGRLLLRMLSPVPVLARGLALHPDDETDPFAFRLDLSRFGLGGMRVLFSRAPDGTVTAVHLDVMPLTADKRPAATNQARWAGGVTALAATAVLAGRLRPDRGSRR